MKFKTLPEEVSDHLALFLNFEVAAKAVAENSGSRQKGKQDGARN